VTTPRRFLLVSVVPMQTMSLEALVVTATKCYDLSLLQSSAWSLVNCTLVTTSCCRPLLLAHPCRSTKTETNQMSNVLQLKSPQKQKLVEHVKVSSAVPGDSNSHCPCVPDDLESFEKFKFQITTPSFGFVLRNDASRAHLGTREGDSSVVYLCSVVPCSR
jgi:hypothetical protein